MAQSKEVTLALPGFSELIRREIDRAGAMDLRAKEYTAVRIRKDYPLTYESVARALFFYRLPVKTCADLFRMNAACVAAIRDQVIAESQTNAAAGFLVETRRRSQRDIVLARLTDAIAEKLECSATVAEMSVTELASVLEKLEKAPAARNGTESVNEKKSAVEEAVEVVDYDELINGLNTEKISASSDFPMNARLRAADDPTSASDEEPENPGECSTGNDPQRVSSFEMSNIGVDSCEKGAESERNDEVQKTLCNNLCTSVKMSAGEPGDFGCAEKARGSAALEALPGGGGTPSDLEGGLDNNASAKQEEVF